MRDEDWSLVDEMDTAGIGEERSLLLRSLVANSHCALVWPNCGTVCGWGIIQPRFGADYIGPGSCTNSEGLLPLVTALLGKVEAQSIVWDIPDQNHAAVSVARRLDFQTVRPLTRMRLGEPVPAKDSATQFAIADPAWG
jgi:hypothetical protein